MKRQWLLCAMAVWGAAGWASAAWYETDRQGLASSGASTRSSQGPAESQAVLAYELRLVAEEIKADLAATEAQKNAALQVLSEGPGIDHRANLQRMLSAFACIDAKLATAVKQSAAGQHDKAVQTIKPTTVRLGDTRHQALRQYMLGMSLCRAGLAAGDRKQVWQGIDALAVLDELDAELMSVSAAALLEKAQSLDKLNRRIYATSAYARCLKDYEHVLNVTDAKGVRDRLAELEPMCRDPLGSIGGWMGQAAANLERSESGKLTQAVQREATILLEDMIATLEEQPSPDTDPDPNRRPVPPSATPPEPDDSGGAKVRPSRPVLGRPAVKSAIGDESAPPRKIGNRQVPRGTDGIELPPRERDALQEAAAKVMSERYRDIIRDYYLRLAE